jgi:hypothetical protein
MEVVPIIITPNYDRKYDSTNFGQFMNSLLPILLKLKEENRNKFVRDQVIKTLSEEFGSEGQSFSSLYPSYDSFSEREKEDQYFGVCSYHLEMLNINKINSKNLFQEGDKYYTPYVNEPLFDEFIECDEFDSISGKGSLGVVGSIGSLVLRIKLDSEYFPIIEIQDLLDFSNSIQISSKDDWIEKVDKVVSPIYNTYFRSITSSMRTLETSIDLERIKREPIFYELKERELKQINDLFEHWTLLNIDSGLFIDAFGMVARVLSIINTKYAFIIENNNPKMIKI